MLAPVDLKKVQSTAKKAETSYQLDQFWQFVNPFLLNSDERLLMSKLNCKIT